MTQEEEKEKKRSNRPEVKLSLANREAKSLFKAQQKKKKKWISITEKANLFNHVSIINNGYEAKRCQQKKKSDNTTKHMEIEIQAMGIHFDEEITMEILSRLPVQSLLRFKCVLKSWKVLITEPYFKMKHLNHAKNNRNSQKLLIGKKCIDRDYMFNFYSSSLSSSFQVVEDENKLDCPSNCCKPVNSVIYCCCDGLVLLSVIDELDKRLLLWNPSIGESIELPYPNFFPLDDCVWGLAYDATIDDYKILAVGVDGMFAFNILILTLKSGYWRYLCKRPHGIRAMVKARGCCVDFLAFVHGSFHWVGLLHCSTVISLSISNFVFGEIPLLEQMWNTPDLNNDNHGVTVLMNGMLCFYHSYVVIENMKGTFKLWVMKEYGVMDSWTILLSVVGAGSFYYLPVMPIYMYADGEVLLHSRLYKSRESVFCTSRDSFHHRPRCHTLRQGTVYTESLISPKSLI